MRNIILILLATLALLPSNLFSQKKNKVETVSPSPAGERLLGYAKRKELEQNSLFSAIPFRCIGPTVMSGRVVDIEVNPNNPAHFYVAYASGGLWVTHNHGASFEPLFQNEMVMTIGDIAVDWGHGERIWIGSGENNSSRSSYSGFGIYRSDDLGKTWHHSGLEESHHIGRVLIDPLNPDHITVASLGHLYSANDQRGIFNSVDGGKTWTKSLFIGTTCGAIDIVRDPFLSNELYCATWERSREAHNFIESGSGSGIWKSTDNGMTWQLISSSETGFPSGAGTGRIGLAVHNSGAGPTIYALVDNQDPREEKTEESQGLKKEDFIAMSPQALIALPDSLLDSFLRKNDFPEEHTAQSIKRDIASGKLIPPALYDYLYSANEALFDRPVKGAEVYRYSSQNSSWTRTHENHLDDLFYSYGYYFGLIRVNPNNVNEIFIGGVPLIKSTDGGATWKSINPENVHGDHHALWINPENPNHLINGNDGGVNISFDGGVTYINCNSPAVGQFYTVEVDNAEPYNVYGGLQDNGVWVGPSNNVPDRGWHQNGHYPFEFLMGGDGMQVQVDTRDNQTIFTGYQFGYYSRLHRQKGWEASIHPSHILGEKPLRWNWQTPILLSKHQQDVFYIGSNRIHRSLDQGKHFETLSPDLTHGATPGDVPFGTITSISESPLRFGWLAAGTDDGRVHISVDNGYTWSDISTGLPRLWVSRVVMSEHRPECIYVTLNGYRKDHFKAYVYVSEDLGKTWKFISAGLPFEPVNVLVEDPISPNILYAGTDHGLYITTNLGMSWQSFGAGLPSAPVHDLAIQERDMDLVVATHGRSIWIADIEYVSAIDSLSTKSLEVFAPKTVRRGNWGNRWSMWSEFNVPDWKLAYFTSLPVGSDIVVSILLDGIELHTFSVKVEHPGFGEIPWDFSISKDGSVRLSDALSLKGNSTDEIKPAGDGKIYLSKGTYQLTLKSNGQEVRTNLIIE